MTHTKDEALKLAQSALKDIANETYDTGTNGEKAQRIAEAALPIIEQALEAQHEPVAWMHTDGHIQGRSPNWEPVIAHGYTRERGWTPLYTTPPAAQPEPVTHPYGWHTEDHLTDKSATTYSKEVADRWKAKGWTVTPMYAASQAQPAPEKGQP